MHPLGLRCSNSVLGSLLTDYPVFGLEPNVEGAKAAGSIDARKGYH